MESIAGKIYNSLDSRTATFYKRFDGKRFQKDKYIQSFVEDYVFMEENDKVKEFAECQKDVKYKQKYIEDLKREVEQKFVETAKEASANGYTTEFDYERYIPCVDLVTSKEFLLLRDTGNISKTSYESWRKLTPPDIKNILMLSPAKLVFDPYQPEPYLKKDFEGMPVTHINTYTHPDWMKNEENWPIYLSQEEQEKLTCPRPIMEFLEYLFPNEDCLDFVINWMHYALLKRCETYLVLNGKKGVGKGIFTEYILKNLIGEPNFRIAPESMLESNFNAALENVRLLVLDELRAENTAKLSKLKKYANANQNIEKKGVDAKDMTQIYYSAVISNNDLSDMYLTWDERRFSVVDLPKDTLLDTWGKKKIEDFITYLEEDKEAIKQFGYWIFYKGKSEVYHEISSYKGDRYFSIVYNSLSEWKKVIFDMITDKRVDDVFPLGDCKSTYKTRVSGGRFPMKIQRIREFLEDFRWKGDKLGKLVFDDDIQDMVIEKEEKFKSLKVKKVKQTHETNKQDSFGLL